VASPDHKALQIKGLRLVTYQGHTYWGVRNSSQFFVIWGNEKPVSCGFCPGSWTDITKAAFKKETFSPPSLTELKERNK
jgi:hypothetical protein